MRRNRAVLWLALSIAVACLVTTFLFRDLLLMGLGGELIVADRLEKADLIYVLAGDFFGSRVLSGAELGARGYAPRVLLSGGRYSNEFYGNRFSGDLAVQFAVEHGYSPKLFQSVRLESVSTLEEARAMGPVFRRLGAKRVILVTSNFHSRRARLVFRMILPDIDFRVVPSADRDFDPSSWWKTDRGRHLVISEYEKIFGSLFLGRRASDAGLHEPAAMFNLGL